MKALVLAGGSGTRLWPLSRRNFPKQFLKLNGNKSFLQQTVDRLLNIVSAGDIVIMTNSGYKFHVLSDLNSLLEANQQPAIANIILEPFCRNTAPAIALGIRYCIDKLGCKNDEVIFVSPSDHIIRSENKFTDYVKHAGEMAQAGYIITFGVRPDRPETGYGYIRGGQQLSADSNGFLKVDKFVEKPDAKTAKSYMEEGNYYWNSGMFAFSIGTMIGELQEYAPEIGRMAKMSYDEMLSNFIKMPDVSIDYTVMEKSKKVVTMPLELYWNDIGSWDSLSDIFDKDECGNIKSGDCITIDTKETMILGNKRLITTIGLEDCMVVETDDALLITRKGQSQKVKNIVESLKSSNRREAFDHLTTFRPWGSFTVLEDGERYKIKRIVVESGEKLSLQMHHHRSEHWVVIKGIAKVTIGGKEMFIHENESAYVPKSTPHRLENPGKVLLEIIEVQNGEYVGEDDIFRFEDKYER